MSLLFLLAVSKSRALKTVTFNASTNWTPPAGVARLESLVGRGADGVSGIPGTPTQKTDYQYTFYRSDGGPPSFQTTTVDGWPKGSSYYCDPYTTFDSPPYNAYYVCYRPYTEYVGGTSDQTGQSTTAFGKTFPGGAGRAASSSSYQQVPLVAGTAYPITVAPGGFVTITYYQ